MELKLEKGNVSCCVDEQFVLAQVENVKISGKQAHPRCLSVHRGERVPSRPRLGYPIQLASPPPPRDRTTERVLALCLLHSRSRIFLYFTLRFHTTRSLVMKLHTILFKVKLGLRKLFLCYILMLELCILYLLMIKLQKQHRNSLIISLLTTRIKFIDSSESEYNNSIMELLNIKARCDDFSLMHHSCNLALIQIGTITRVT